MPHPKDSTLNEPSLKQKRLNLKRLFTYLVLSIQYSQNIAVYNGLGKTTDFFIINATPIRQHLKRNVFKQKRLKSEEIFHPSNKLCTL